MNRLFMDHRTLSACVPIQRNCVALDRNNISASFVHPVECDTRLSHDDCSPPGNQGNELNYEETERK